MNKRSGSRQVYDSVDKQRWEVFHGWLAWIFSWMVGCNLSRWDLYKAGMQILSGRFSLVQLYSIWDLAIQPVYECFKQNSL